MEDAGIIRNCNFLHVCGGVSLYCFNGRLGNRFSPRMWRCFRSSRSRSPPSSIFSTYVEVFLSVNGFSIRNRNFLHVCGGVSGYLIPFLVDEVFSPRMWRCFRDDRGTQTSENIFSTYVEVFLSINVLRLIVLNFLHVCGGVSNRNTKPENKGIFSPRMWRCFLWLSCSVLR